MSRNLDMQELDYNPTKKDLTDAKIHHLLAEELKPYKRVSVVHVFTCSVVDSNNASYWSINIEVQTPDSAAKAYSTSINFEMTF